MGWFLVWVVMDVCEIVVGEVMWDFEVEVVVVVVFELLWWVIMVGWICLCLWIIVGGLWWWNSGFLLECEFLRDFVIIWCGGGKSGWVWLIVKDGSLCGSGGKIGVEIVCLCVCGVESCLVFFSGGWLLCEVRIDLG